ncbi:MAG TPA: hypothetical protein VFE58_17240 [Tepidisphaeraceae bacterium]|jgi:hypothetical protein|nr:hypothetical protein [Tepidisphaeraceae bacterium]
MPETQTDKTTRPVLVWHPDNDESQVLPTPQKAADFLKVPLSEVLAAITSGELLNGRFVDWQA